MITSKHDNDEPDYILEGSAWIELENGTILYIYPHEGPNGVEYTIELYGGERKVEANDPYTSFTL